MTAFQHIGTVFSDFLTKKRVVWSIVLAVTLAATLHKYSLGAGLVLNEHINNFLIFRASFVHLVQGVDLYTLHPAEHLDYFKYSPTFALFMGGFAWLPVWAGVCVWNLLNTALLLWFVYRLPIENSTAEQRVVAISVWIFFVELLTAVQNAQSNALLAACALAACVAFERKRLVEAALWIALSFHVKIFGAAVAVMFLLYPQRMRFCAALAAWLAVLTALPLVVVSPAHLSSLYSSWMQLLRNDHSASLGVSVVGMLAPVLGSPKAVLMLQAASLVVLCLPFVRFAFCNNSADTDSDTISGTLALRLHLLASVLVWMVIFNHKAESPTFILAMTGVAVWFFVWFVWGNTAEKRVVTGLVWCAIVFTSLSVTDVFPPVVREHIFEPISMKAIPCAVIWCVMQWQVWRAGVKSKRCT